MYNSLSKSKVKKPITDKNKINQVKSWNKSDINKQIIKNRKIKVHFDTTTRFLDACINFYIDEMNNLLDSGVDVNCADKDHLTALHQACINTRIDIVEFLLNKKANINVCDKEGWTPLHIAADMGSYELAKFLIEHGARLDIANYDGELPISFVNEKEYPDLKKYFQHEMYKRKIDAEECSNYEKFLMLADVKNWISSGKYDPPIDMINKSTPVHVAASKNYSDILMELLPMLKYDDINVQDIDGWTPLHAAAHWGHHEACKILINNGANIDIRTRANETILDIVDPDLKNVLTVELEKIKMEQEKIKFIENKNDVPVRPDNSNRRRSSITRQSVLWKKNTQMKDPASEREMLIKAMLNADSSSIRTIEECDERLFSPRQNKSGLIPIKLEKDSDCSPDLSSEISESKTSVTTYDITDLANKIDDVKGSQCTKISTIPFSNGDNDKTNIVSSAQPINRNNGALINEIPSEVNSDSEEIRQSHENMVRLRPKSVRDQIMSHRNTVDDRLSLVMAPAKTDESEVMRREKARRVRSMRRSTQAIDIGGYKDLEEKKSIETTKDLNLDNSTKLESKPTSNESNEVEFSVIESNAIFADKKINDISKSEYKSIDIERKDYSKLDIPIISNSQVAHKTNSLVCKNNNDNIDNQRRTAYKYQVSCPIPYKNQPIAHDRARLNISNTIKGLIMNKPVETQEPVSTDSKTDLLPIRGLNVNRCIESSDFSVNIESPKDKAKKYSIKSQESYSIQNTDVKEKDSGSFVAKPVIRSSSAVVKSTFDDLNKFQEEKHQIPLAIVENDENNGTSSTSDSSDISCLKDRNHISKSVISKMLNDQTTKNELVKEINFLKEEIKELKDKSKQSDSNSTVHDKKSDKNSEDGGLLKYEQEMSKLKEENKKLKSQNEALLRVISRIQTELEGFRKIQID